ncbi:MAG: hypothetical protein APF76_16880 [Desulfitibacter sp. BRH_c19]|nr:MAG: hypothetical protein APF76_16880 [Desulfitibacter sp. BRH_c19]
MSVDIRLKAGFFKTQLYSLGVCQNQLILIPKENTELNRIIVTANELMSVTVFKRGSKIVELEIKTKDTSYIGHTASETNLEELFFTFSGEFGNKLTIVNI